MHKDLLFDIIAENIDLGIAIVNKDGYFTFYNDIMGQIEGLDSKDIIGKHIFDLFPSFDQKAAQFTDA